MARIFEEHTLRSVKSLDGIWRFCKDGNDTGLNEAWQNGLLQYESVAVPSVWNTEKGNLTYEGVAWYEKSFSTEGGCLRFCFGAVMTEAEVWLDGKHLGSHYGGFSQFDFIVPDVSAGVHRLTVRVDNRFDARSIPQARVDWYHYGGIPRGVSVEILKGICILSNRLNYTISKDLKNATCNLTVELYNADMNAQSVEVAAEMEGESIGAISVSTKGHSYATVAFPTFEKKNVRLWDVGSPALYEICIHTETDDLFDRVGFRKIEVQNGQLLLNGRAIEIRGVNRHEEHPDWGFAFPLNLMRRDIDLAVEMGCNAIRGSHYPNSQEFVDLLDERGLLFWSEIPIWGWGFSEEALADPIVVERGLEMHREMVKYYFNHPCIILWGMHNEIQLKTQAAYRMTEVYYHYLKQNGGNRLVVYASDKPWEDICFSLCDVICLNQYYGWYYGYEEDAWEKFLEKFCERKRALGMEEKPMIMSEFGCAAVYGHHDDEGILWSEENQAKQLTHCLQVFHAHREIVGSFIWQFADMRTCLEAGINRARGFNNKGILNEYRKPKLAYLAAKKCYTAFAEEVAERKTDFNRKKEKTP